MAEPFDLVIARAIAYAPLDTVVPFVGNGAVRIEWLPLREGFARKRHTAFADTFAAYPEVSVSDLLDQVDALKARWRDA